MLNFHIEVLKKFIFAYTPGKKQTFNVEIYCQAFSEKGRLNRNHFIHANETLRKFCI